VLPVVRGEVAHGGQLLLGLLQAILDQQLRGLAARDEAGIRGPLDPNGIRVITSSPAVQANETRLRSGRREEEQQQVEEDSGGEGGSHGSRLASSSSLAASATAKHSAPLLLLLLLQAGRQAGSI